MNTREIHDIVNRIKSSLFKNSNSYSIGMLKSHFRGTGLKFKEHQVYSHGDDVRFIDWNMLAKTNSPYIKTFEEERNVVISVIIDCTTTMFMGYEGKSKIEISLEVVSLLYLLSEKTNDFIEVILCTGEKNIRIPKRNGEKGIVALVKTLKIERLMSDDGSINHSFNKKNQIESKCANELIVEFYKKREVVLLTDFYNFLYGRDLKRLLVNKHVHAFRLLTPLDYSKDFKFEINAININDSKESRIDIQTKESDLAAHDLGLNVKNLKIENRYLEEFIKEML